MSAQPNPIQIEPVKTEIVLEPTIKLGSLALRPHEVIQKATEIATQLAKIINRRKLYTMIQGKKHVWVEGWATMGAVLGVAPIEEWSKPTPDGFGFEAKVNLVRLSDGVLIGSASAQCTTEENKWKGRDSYAIRSMAITRATGKAFRLSFAWIMKLAGYEALPAEEAELDYSEAKEEQRRVAENRVSEIQLLMEAQKKAGKAPTMFCLWPSAHNGHYAVLSANKDVIAKVWSRITPEMKA